MLPVIVSTQLSKDVGLLGLISLSIGAMIGGGIFVLPGLAAGMMGPSIWIAYLLAGLLVIAPSLCKIELATALPGAGGTYLFVERSIGPLAGTMAGLGVWMVLVFKASFALVGVGYYLEHFRSIPIEPVAISLLFFLMMINCLGAKKAARFQVVVVAASLLTLLILSSGGMIERTHSLAPSVPGGLAGLLAATGFVFISYAGVTSIASITEEVARPARDLPLGILISLSIMITLYVVVSLSLMAVVHWEDITEDKSPMATFAEAVFGRVGLLVVAPMAMLALVSMANAGLMAASRYPMAMSRDNLMPPALKATSRRFGTPVISILLTGGIMTAIILFLDVAGIAKMASVFQILVFSAECLCVILLRESKSPWYKPTFRAPLYPGLPVFGLVSGIALVLLLGPIAWAGSTIVSLIGVVWYFVYGRTRTDRRRGVWQQIGRRSDLLPRRGLATRMMTPNHRYRPTPEQLLPGAEIVVPLLGREVSPEALIEMAASLSNEDDTMEVLRLKEVPPQTLLSAALAEEEVRIRALERRVTLLGENLHADIHFDTVVTRDVRHQLYNYANRVHSKWVVMEWVPDEWRGVFVGNPLSWWMTHLPCNLALFMDAGNRHIHRIAVAAEPGPHDGLVVATAERLAIRHNASIVFLKALAEDTPEMLVESASDYHDQLSQLCHVETESRILRAADPFRALIEELADYDLLITDPPDEAAKERPFFSNAPDRLLEEAPCSVLELKSPRKEAHLAIEPKFAETKSQDIISYLDQRTLKPALQVADKNQLFQYIAESFAAPYPDFGGTEAIKKALWKRERMQNTAIGEGIAIPHATLPGCDQTRFGVFVTATPVNYGAPGAQGVDLFFATAGPPSDRTTHLQLIASLSRLLPTDGFVDTLRSVQSAEEIERAFHQAGQVLDRG